MNILKSLHLTLILFFFSLIGWSQNTLTYTKNDSHYRDGLEYFERSNYAAAKVEFTKFLDNADDAEKYHNYDQISAEYYVVVCNLYLNAPEADIQANRFVSEHPNHPKSATLFKELGNYYFASQNYEKAIYYFKKVSRNLLTVADQAEVGFKLGISYYNSGELKNSLEQFSSVKNLDDDTYSPQAAYYAAVVEFKEENWEAAIADFKRIEKNEKYRSEAPIWIANAYYKQAKFDELIDYAEPLLKPTNKEKYVGELAVMVADIYFQKNDYTQANIYYDLLKKASKAPIAPEVRYRIGFSQYKTKRFAEAIDNLKLVATRNDDLGQYSSYYLGVCYLNTQNLAGALAAFDAARRMTFNPSIKEDAAFNHAKVQISMGNSTAAIKELLEFSKSFPNSAYDTEVSELLTDAYLTSNNYQAAISYIEGLKKRSPKINLIYQRMTYNQGINEFNVENYPKSIFYFIKSVQAPEDIDLKTAADYYKAESFYLQKKYTDALTIYNELQNVGESSKGAEYSQKALYSMAYIYYNQANYEKAASMFKAYTDKLKDTKVRPNYDDAMVRLADCYFVQKNFQAASQIYDIVALGGQENKDYALYQKAQTLQFQGKDGPAKDIYNKIIKDYPNSTYSDDALYKSGEIELNADNYIVAAGQFTKLIQTKQKSVWVPNAYLKRAITNTNLKNYDASISDYRFILANFPTHATSEDALLGLQDVLNTVGKSEEFSNDLSSYKQKNPTGSSTENLEYETAKNIYFALQYNKAIPALSNFLANYPNSASGIEAKYYLADSYNRTNDRQNALKYFYSVINGPSSNYISRAAFRAAEIENTLKNYPKAIVNYKLWAQTSNSKTDQQKAYLGIMEGYYALKNFDSTIVASHEVIALGNVVANSINKGTLYLGKAYMGKNDLIRANTEFENTIKLAKDEYGAEAKYNMALITYNGKNYKQTIELVKQLNADFPDYENWRGKGFLLIADCYIALNDSLNAKAVLNSIIDNSEDTELIVQAKQRLSNIK
jgi:tetratricopeptide (TPR) repeat protein